MSRKAGVVLQNAPHAPRKSRQPTALSAPQQGCGPRPNLSAHDAEIVLQGTIITMSARHVCSNMLQKAGLLFQSGAHAPKARQSTALPTTLELWAAAESQRTRSSRVARRKTAPRHMEVFFRNGTRAPRRPVRHRTAPQGTRRAVAARHPRHTRDQKCATNHHRAPTVPHESSHLNRTTYITLPTAPTRNTEKSREWPACTEATHSSISNRSVGLGSSQNPSARSATRSPYHGCNEDCSTAHMLEQQHAVRVEILHKKACMRLASGTRRRTSLGKASMTSSAPAYATILCSNTVHGEHARC